MDNDRPPEQGFELFNRYMRRNIPPDFKVQLPPPILLELGAEVVRIDEAEKRLVMRYPVQPRWENPLAYQQGGLLIAMIDNTMGPLAWMFAPPNATVQLNSSFIRPTTPDEDYVHVEAWITEITRRYVFVSARAYNSAGKTLVRAESISQILFATGAD